MNIRVMRVWLTIVVLGAVVSSCLSPRADPSQFYILAPTAEPTGTLESSDVSVGIGPVTIPAYLDRPQMVTRLGPNEVTLSEQHRWVSPMAAEFTQTVVTNLTRLLGTNRIRPYPWYRTAAPVYAVAIDVQQFEAGPDGVVWLRCTWSVRDPATETEIVNRESSYSDSTPPADVAASVGVLSRLVELLSREIAAVIRETASR